MNLPELNRLGRVVSPRQTDFITQPLGELALDEVRIRIRASALCGSDYHIFKDLHPSVCLPCTIGHEFSGDVCEVGRGVTSVAPGSRVTVEPCIVCGACDACRHGQYGYCENISFTYRNGSGAMADYITVREPYVYPLPERLSYEAGALVEPLAVATHAVRRADVKLGERVMIIGCGAIGILVGAVCKRAGASLIAVSDYSDTRLAAARALGATHTINPGSQPPQDAAFALTGGVGMDKTFECVGLEATFHQAVYSLRKNGLATIVGIFEKPQITIDASRFVTHEIRVQGAQGYCWDFPAALSLSGEIDLERLITHRFALKELQCALETCLNPQSGSIKAVLTP